MHHHLLWIRITMEAAAAYAIVLYRPSAAVAEEFLFLWDVAAMVIAPRDIRCSSTLPSS